MLVRVVRGASEGGEGVVWGAGEGGGEGGEGGGEGGEGGVGCW